MSHTKGPWTVNSRAIEEVKEPSSVIAIVNDGDDNGDEQLKGEWKANARLISAAPDLLEACKKAIEFINNGVEFGYIQLPEKGDSALLTQPMLEQAIAKAEGK